MKKSALRRFGTLRETVSLAAPVAASQLGMMVMNLVDAYLVGRLGPAALAGVGFANAIFYGIALFSSGCLFGLDYLVSHAFGRGDRQACHYWLVQAVSLSLALAASTAAIVFVLPVGAFGLPREVESSALLFLRLLGLGVAPLLLFVAFRQYLAGMGSVRVTTGIMVFANLANALFGWALIHGHLGFPALGVTGAGYATTGTRTLMAASLIGYTLYRDRSWGGALTQISWFPRLTGMRKLLALGAPAGLQMMVRAAVFSVISTLVGWLGAVPLAAHTIVMNLASLLYMVPLGISVAASVLVAQALGRGEGDTAKAAGWVSVAVSGACAGVLGLVLFAFGERLVALFTADLRVISVGRSLLLFAVAFQFADSVQTAATGALRGTSDTRSSLLANIVGFWGVALPVAYYLGIVRREGAQGIWLGLILGLFVVSSLVTVRWLSFDPRSFPSLSHGGTT